MCWTPGSPPLCGPSPPWAGRTRREDLDYFYPTDVLVTGYDIIFFWVARMIFSGCEQTKKPPFHTVLIHGLVRDDKGRKMSKSLGNGIDPLEMVDKYGCRRPALQPGHRQQPRQRHALLHRAVRGHAQLRQQDLERQPLPADEPDHRRSALLPEQLELEDKWILSKLNAVIREVTDNMETL